ncbi:pyrroline-5-carboxylate reductase [Alkalibacterium iburiense]|uniref:Pyrroline-5-carboxylate reductase n=1 Tax=Alkalibacterium iburiense TaxID=290589 RepID=A0ABP3H1I8_9LACT
MNIGFIGFGNMAKTIANGLINEEVTQKERVFFSTRTKESRQKTEKEWGITGVESNQAVIDSADVIILAMKPHQFDEVLQPLTIPKEKLVISVAAGVTSTKLEEHLSKNQYFRVMPNLNAQVQASMTAIVENKEVDSRQKEVVETLFSAIGEVVFIPEEQLSVFIALAGSSPAIVFLMIDTLARSAVKYGMSKDTATKIAAQAVLGSGKTVHESATSPWDLIDQVSSPGGITVEAILNLMQSGFSGSLIQAVDKMVEKDNKLSNN